jgi:hypothetical protein
MTDYIYYNNLTDTQLLDLIDEHYYSIGATGAQALEALREDIPAWETKHGVPQARMEIVLGWFENSLIERGLLDVVAGLIVGKPMTRKMKVGRFARMIRKVGR